MVDERQPSALIAEIYDVALGPPWRADVLTNSNPPEQTF